MADLTAKVQAAQRDTGSTEISRLNAAVKEREDGLVKMHEKLAMTESLLADVEAKNVGLQEEFKAKDQQCMDLRGQVELAVAKLGNKGKK